MNLVHKHLFAFAGPTEEISSVARHILRGQEVYYYSDLPIWTFPHPVVIPHAIALAGLSQLRAPVDTRPLSSAYAVASERCLRS